jgi:uncharacterized protein (TIGR03032 family)
MAPAEDVVGRLWRAHDEQWRDPAQIVGLWGGEATVNRRLLRSRATGQWWDLLARHGITLLVAREYEHLVMALAAPDGHPRTTWIAVPHPSGVAVDRRHGVIHLASTRNPNHVLDLRPVAGALERGDSSDDPIEGRPLVPTASRFLPGCLYLHDLAMVGGVLHASAVGQNAVVRLDASGGHEPVWWPRSVEKDGRPDMRLNYLQLNSIAAGPDLAGSCFTASSEWPSRRRPGHRNYPVDRRGVVFSGRSREPIARGLTRPHSARWFDGDLLIGDSGYGELVRVGMDGRVDTVCRLPGWTRGLCIHDGIALVGTSRVIPRFRQYAPGLDVARSVCGVHAVDLRSGEVLGSLRWPLGNQIFAVEWVPADDSLGFPFPVGRRSARSLFYRFVTSPQEVSP